MGQNVSGRKYRVLLVCSHPIQYGAPLFRLMALHPELDICVAYCSLQGAEAGLDPQFGVEVRWDVPLLDGYPWNRVPNRSWRPGLGRFFGLINPGLWQFVRKGGFDVVVVYGYAYCSFCLAIAAAKSTRIPVIVATDSVRLHSPHSGWRWKRWLKKPVIEFIYRRVASVVLVPSTATKRFIESLGVGRDRIVFSHYTVDNDYFERAAARADRNAVRDQWGIPPESFVILFCAKLACWKRPQDVMAAFARLQSRVGAALPSHLVFAGEGALRSQLEAETRRLKLESRVRFLGFVNQSKLPEVYRAADVLVLPSEHEPWGLVVNEAMACGLPVVVSDCVGAGLDLVSPGVTGAIYPVGEVEALAAVLCDMIVTPVRVRRMGEAARDRVKTWSYRENLQGFLEAVRRAAGMGD